MAIDILQRFSESPESIKDRHDRNLARLLEATLEAVHGNRDEIKQKVTRIYNNKRNETEKMAKGNHGYTPLFTAKAAKEEIYREFPGIKLPTGDRYKFE